jgi:hypothetical protein
MKKTRIFLLSLILVIIYSPSANSQRKASSENKITSSDLESNVSFLASPLLKGRKNGEEGLEIAAQYLASQAKLAGLKPANGLSYFQSYSVIRKTMDTGKTGIQIISANNDTVTLKDPFYPLVPTGPSDLSVSGEVVFAGYGIKSVKYNYNDFDSLKAEGKILLVMDRAPMTEDGKKCQFTEPNWATSMSFQMKIQYLMFSKAKAILFVPDPKSGFESFSQSSQGLADYLYSGISLKSEKEVTNNFMQSMPKVLFVNRSVADAILKGSGHTLDELQKNIDESHTPHSFAINDKQISITETVVKEEKTLNNVAGYIEGRDPALKNETVVFSAHYDHIGASGNSVNPGADDDASGCASLLSMAKAYMSLDKKPLRSILFLWVSGEEIGLFGSQTYVNNPLFPLEKTIVDLNMDMIGRVKSAADTSSSHPMTGPNNVFVITDNQSKELLEIANEIDLKTPLDFDYSLSGRNHPLQLFSRSDHYNFVKKDIPVLFFSTGIHSDYHTPQDIIGKLDFKKMELITRTMYKIGLTVANKKTRIVVDNPYSSWGKSK